MRLFYNANHPVEILEQLRIKSSIINRRNRGVSMSSCIINSHGAFTFIFKSDLSWYNQFSKVSYGLFDQFDNLCKNVMFADEHEWWSANDVLFTLNDVERVIFRSQSPAARMHPIITKRNYEKLRIKYGQLVD